MTGPNRATVWLRFPSGRCDPVEVDIDPPDTLAALTKWERVTGRTDLCVVTARPAPPGAGPPNPVLGLPAIVGEPADSCWTTSPTSTASAGTPGASCCAPKG